ncbi:glutamine amidotransferase [Emcibacter nanhaiensis]|uniref:Glutamine amidotransferase n=1 Tax=Emcibacter nanhaiensis TaxID=1505037 RepID=A0A501PLC4_9PROT|nr:glutamine amidotransferase [Emcibacter nanhaiensis]TPD60651.1 glutamine amidotransferase [Emcibacter nanhaiensis]
MTEKQLLILQTGGLPDSTPEILDRFGDMGDIFLTPTGLDDQNSLILRLHEGELPNTDPQDYAGILITGSPLMLSCPSAWMIDIGPWLQDAIKKKVPTLGVCFGHQLLAHALGGKIGPNPNGLEAGTVSVEFSAARKDDPLFSLLSDEPLFQVHHYESILELPEGAEVLARNAHENYHAVRFGPMAWSIQFHPEISVELIRTLLMTDKENLLTNGYEPDRILAGLQDTPEGPALLQRFRDIAFGRV